MTRSRGIVGLRMTPARRISVIALAIALAGGIIVSVFMQQIAERRAEDAATGQVQQIIDQVLAPTMRAGQVDGPLSGNQYQHLRDLVTAYMLGGDITEVSILQRDGTAVFAVDRSLVGGKSPGDRTILPSVFAGFRSDRVYDTSAGRVLETYTPLRVSAGGPVVAAVKVTENYDAILSSSSQLWQYLQIGLAAALGLCLLLLALSFRATPGKTQWNPGLQQPVDTDARLIQAAEQARQAEEAFHRVSNELRQVKERLEQADAERRTLFREGSEAEQRAVSADRTLKSTDAALTAARGQLAKLDERVKLAEGGGRSAAQPTAEPAAVARARELREQLLRVEAERSDARRHTQEAREQLTRAEEKLHAIEERVLEDERRKRQTEERLRALEAEKRAAEERAARAETERQDTDDRLAELGRAHAGIDAERGRLAAELTQTTSRTEELARRVEAAQAAQQALQERVRQAEEARAGAQARAEELQRLNATSEEGRAQLQIELERSRELARALDGELQKAEAKNRLVVEVDEPDPDPSTDEPAITWEPTPERLMIQELQRLAHED